MLCKEGKYTSNTAQLQKENVGSILDKKIDIKIKLYKMRNSFTRKGGSTIFGTPSAESSFSYWREVPSFYRSIK